MKNFHPQSSAESGGERTLRNHSLRYKRFMPPKTRAATRRLSPSPTSPRTPRRQYRSRSPTTPGPLTAERRRQEQQASFPAGPPVTPTRSAALRRSLFEILPLNMPPKHNPRALAAGGSSASQRSSSQPSPTRSHSSSPRHKQHQPQPPDLNEQLTQLTAIVEQVVRVQRQQQQQPPPAMVVAPGPREQPAAAAPPADPGFQWQLLKQDNVTNFPPATEGQVQRIAAGLLAKLQALSGRDHHEISFVLSMAADFPDMDPEQQNRVYQRLNLLYLATHHGWGTAIAASNATSASAAVLPPGFVLDQRTSRYDRRQPP